MNESPESSSGRNTPLVVAMLAAALVVVAAMVVAVFLATQRPVVLVVPAAGGSVATGGPPIAPASSTPPADVAPVSSPVTTTEPVLPLVTVARASRFPASTDPFDAAWASAPSTELWLDPQQVTPPMLEGSQKRALTIQGLRDDGRIAWRVSWAEDSPESLTETGRFADALALQFPLADGAPYTMGGPGAPVQVLYWKALWQKDVDEGFQSLEALHPNSAADFHWFTDPPLSKDFPAAFAGDLARQYQPAWAASNPMCEPDRKSPVEEITAEGFGSATSTRASLSDGRGVHRDGRWTVVVERSLDTKEALTQRWMSDPARQLVAVALWDGSAGHRGARKHITNWVPMRIEP